MKKRPYSKVFGIGDNKTGTTSLETVFRQLGFIVPDQYWQELKIMPSYFKGNIDPMISVIKNHEAFQDAPFSISDTYVACDVEFPDSKFILTVRNPDEWFDSLCRFHKKIWNLGELTTLTEADIRNIEYLFPEYMHTFTTRFLTVVEGDQERVRWDLIYNREYYVNEHVRRDENIRRYFTGRPQDLLEIDITREADTAKICDFLGFARAHVTPMPHENRSR